MTHPTPTRLALLAAAFAAFFLAIPAYGQATTEERARARDADRPAPAAERFGQDHRDHLDHWWHDATFYHLFVRSFKDSTGDGIGDFRGLIEKLDYLNDGDPETDTDLGIDAIWLMPIHPAPSYHGYDVADYRAINPEHGTTEDFKAFMQACKDRGIRVVIDLVINHSSSQHEWFQKSIDPDSEYRDWYIWRDQRPDWRGPWGQNVWHPSPARDGTYYYGIFWHGMPDLNFEHEPVTQAIFDLMSYWLHDMDIDGFRLDAIRHLIEDGPIQENTPATHAWLRRFFDETKRLKPDAFSVGEVWSGTEDVSRYVGDQMDTAFEFGLSYALVDALRDAKSERLVGSLREVQRVYPLGMYATFLRNHDQPRVMHELGNRAELARLAAAIQFTLPGVPFIYYGEELGMSADKPDPQLRTPMPWEPISGTVGFTTAEPWIAPKPDYKTVNVRTQLGDPDSMLTHYQRLIRLRQQEEALRRGELTLLESAHDSVFAFVREFEGERVLCVFNLGAEPVRGLGLDLEPRRGQSLLGEPAGDRLGAHGFMIVRLAD
mgnify:CR=1 FL=1